MDRYPMDTPETTIEESGRRGLASTEALAEGGLLSSRRHSALGERVRSGLHHARANLAQASHRAGDKARSAAHATDFYVRENRWKAVTLAGLAGLMIGWLSSRSRHNEGSER